MQSERIRQLFTAAMLVSGLIAAYLMYKRGESPLRIVRKTVMNPVGSLASEVKRGVVSPSEHIQA